MFNFNKILNKVSRIYVICFLLIFIGAQCFFFSVLPASRKCSLPLSLSLQTKLFIIEKCAVRSYSEESKNLYISKQLDSNPED